MKTHLLIAAAVGLFATPGISAHGQTVVIGGEVRIRNEWRGDEVVRGRLRARISAEAQLDYDWDVGFRFVTGGGLTSHNTNMDLLNEQAGVYWDRLFIRHRIGDGFEFLAGRMPNQFKSTMLVWDSDFSPDGLAQTLRTDDGLFLIAGVHPLSMDANKYQTVLFGVQPGFAADLASGEFTASVAYYNFFKADEAPSTPSFTNDVPAGSDYILLDALVSWKGRLLRQPFTAFVQGVVNTSADQDNQALAAGVTLGKAATRGASELSLMAASVGADAFWLPLVDSNLHGRFEAVDMRALAARYRYALGKDVSLGANWYYKREIGGGGNVENIVQVDLSASF